MRSIWSEQNRLEQQVAVEVALAKAEGEFGVIPTQVANTIVKKANATKLSLEKIAQEAAVAKHSLMSTINALQKQVGEAGQYIHYGATTQDIVDTATVLQIKQSFSIIERGTKLVALELKKLAKNTNTYLWPDKLTACKHYRQPLVLNWLFGWMNLFAIYND
nr:lyase family protein [Gilliamella sp. Lep-s35]